MMISLPNLEALVTTIHTGAHSPGNSIPSTSFQMFNASLARLLVIFAVIFTACIFTLILFTRISHARKVVRPARQTIVPPGDLAPALAGALMRGHIRPVLQQATILDLACRKALVIEPIAEHWVALHLLSEKRLQGNIERCVWDVLSREATPEGFVSDVVMKQYNANWAVAGEAVRQELIKRGWYNPRAIRWRIGFCKLGTLGLVIAFFDFLFAGIGQEIWGFGGVGLFLADAIALFISAYYVSETTALGEQMAATWRGYLAGLEAAARQTDADLDLDRAMPYALALGARRFLRQRLQLADTQGYIPVWLGKRDEAQQNYPGFYPYWRAFYHDMCPPSRVLFTSSRNGFKVSNDIRRQRPF